MDALRSLAWNGVPGPRRSDVWRFLLGVLAPAAGDRAARLEDARAAYRAAVVAVLVDVPASERSAEDQQTLRQILVDAPRTCPGVPLFCHDRVQALIVNVLYAWAVAHPRSGYVQGMNDLLAVLLVVLVNNDVPWDGSDAQLLGRDASALSDAELDDVAADAYGMLTSLLGGLEDHYTHRQPGLQKTIEDVDGLLRRVDADLHKHLDDVGVLLLQVTFRWINCLLTRELPMKALIRLWDTCLAEPDGFSSFFPYVCAAFLCHFAETIRNMESEDISSQVGAMGAGASASTIAWEPSCLTPSAAELVRAIKTGEKRCVDVVTAALERIDLVEGNNLRACVEVLRVSALAQAAAVDAKVKAGGDLGALEAARRDQVNIGVAGTLSGEHAGPRGMAAGDVRALRRAPRGGRDPDREDEHAGDGRRLHGPVARPRIAPEPANTAYNCGGSSSGTAAAVAAAWRPAGSGPTPAVRCAARRRSAASSASGRRAGPGRRRAHLGARDTPGPMGATVADVALLDAVVNGEAPVAAPDGLAGVTFGVPETGSRPRAKGDAGGASARPPRRLATAGAPSRTSRASTT
ncbi:hypothetical protein JL721_4369 [Aureococcus anophagefferens]|nr:hypothetical protein JL721_4369 [Aureococcus anophagefferens]